MKWTVKPFQKCPAREIGILKSALGGGSQLSPPSVRLVRLAIIRKADLQPHWIDVQDSQ